IGGGAWSGKDFFKADRAGGLHARRFAKLVVRLGLASEATVKLLCLPGDREARLLEIAAPSALNFSTDTLASLFDLRLKASGIRFASSDLTEIARWGHFSSSQHPWERVPRMA